MREGLDYRRRQGVRQPRVALRGWRKTPLYGDEDFASWAEAGGYMGYRIGMTTDGEWVYFIAGD